MAFFILKILEFFRIAYDFVKSGETLGLVMNFLLLLLKFGDYG